MSEFSTFLGFFHIYLKMLILIFILFIIPANINQINDTSTNYLENKAVPLKMNRNCHHAHLSEFVFNFVNVLWHKQSEITICPTSWCEQN